MRKTDIIGAMAIVLGASYAGPLVAAGQKAAPVTDPATAKECSACHMLYPAGLLPARSWRRLMSGLESHFGDNASLDEATRGRIADYLAANAADSSGRAGKLLRELSSEVVPLRFSETPYFLRKHQKNDRISPATLARQGAKSPADCKACHPGAERGYFDHD